MTKKYLKKIPKNKGGERMPNKRLLKSKMVLFGDNVDALAEYLNQSRQSVYNKIAGKVPFSLQDVSAISKKYNLTNAETYEIFIKRGDEDEQANCEGSCEQA